MSPITPCTCKSITEAGKPVAFTSCGRPGHKGADGFQMCPTVEAYTATKLGTVWIDPGQGATTRELAEKVNEGMYDYMGDALDNLDRLTYDTSYRTNLALTGEPLTSSDVRRIGEAK